MRARRVRLISFQVEAVGPATSNRDVGQGEAQQNHNPLQPAGPEALWIQYLTVPCTCAVAALSCWCGA